MIDTYTTECACGCGQRMLPIDLKGRSRKFINGHNKGSLGKDSRLSVVCATCGVTFMRYRSIASRDPKFCSKKCQYEYEYPGCIWEGKNGYLYFQIGRKQVKTPLHRVLTMAKPGEVVHHINNDPLDNTPENLLVLKGGQSEHMRVHYGGCEGEERC